MASYGTSPSSNYNSFATANPSTVYHRESGMSSGLGSFGSGIGPSNPLSSAFNSGPPPQSQPSYSAPMGIAQPRLNMDEILENIKLFSAAVASIDEQSLAIGTPRDNATCRGKLRQQRDIAKQLSGLINTQIRTINRIVPPNDRSRFEKLSKQYNSQLQRFQNVNAKCVERERDVARSDTKISNTAASSTSALNITVDPAQTEQDLATTRRTILQENLQDLQNIERDVVDIQDLFIDLSKLVNEQGEDLKLVSDNITQTVGRVEEANAQLDSASALRSKQRKKKLCCFIILLVLIGILVGLLVHFLA